MGLSFAKVTPANKLEDIHDVGVIAFIETAVQQDKNADISLKVLRRIKISEVLRNPTTEHPFLRISFKLLQDLVPKNAESEMEALVTQISGMLLEIHKVTDIFFFFKRQFVT